jgi:hypothetical protein
MRLMRHTSLNTTTKYMRTLHDSMKDALASWERILGGLEAASGYETTRNEIGRQIAALRQTPLKVWES